MATYRVCDICGAKLSNSDEEVAFINIAPKQNIKNLTLFSIPINKSYRVNLTEVCEDCAELVSDFIQEIMDDGSKAFIEENRD
ncbi:hypothetical protein [Turicimonas muris]|uniref:hypothetical protein n=1 Tax=Turicimonas muris TaxID=1796652 RepID=UPI00262BDD17|nr:hypothetical protein [Turicimonas muris]